MSDIFERLKAPFPPERVSWRVGSTTHDKARGMALAYIDARDVMERLDEVVGPANWQCRYPHANGKTVCEIGLLVPMMDQWVWKADGAGDTDFEAEKGALSDAFKRAAVRWGIGRYLYDLGAPWVLIEPAGKSFKIKDSEYAKLESILGNGTAKTDTAIANDLIKKIEGTRTSQAFFDLKESADFKSAYGDLPPPERQRVTKAGVLRRQYFDNMKGKAA